MSERVTRADLLEALLDAYDRAQIAHTYPSLSDNYISSVSVVGKRKTPVMYLSLANGQHFEIRAKAVA